jgi:hypothetical protein
MGKAKLVNWFIIGTFVSLYLAVSVISTLHVIKFFELSNPYWLSVSLAVAFELGAAASLASLIVLDKMNKALVWALFIVLTLFQSMGNVYYSYVNLHDFSGWVELFDLVDEEVIYQKRMLSMISGGILPFVALGFIKSLVDYIKPTEEKKEEEEEKVEESKELVLDGGEIVDSDKDEESKDEDIQTVDADADEVFSAEESLISVMEQEEKIEPETLIVNVPVKDFETEDTKTEKKSKVEEMSKEEVASIIGISSEEFIDDDEEEFTEIENASQETELLVDPNVTIPIMNKIPGQSY